jgi:hypothetical protein
VFLSRHFTAGWRKLGTFTITRTANCETRTGGNLVAYFCTPDLTILHAVWGPESPEQFLAQARWAVELAEKLRDAPAAERTSIARAAHEQNPYRTSKGMWGMQGMEHYTRYGHLKEKTLQPLNRANAEELFLKLVNEKASDEPVRIVQDRLFGPPTPSLRPRPRP